jgi:hypothetical protein
VDLLQGEVLGGYEISAEGGVGKYKNASLQWKVRQSIVAPNEYYGPYKLRGKYGSRLPVPREFKFKTDAEYVKHVNPGMGLANINYQKTSPYDADFKGLFRLPLEFGGSIHEIGVFVKQLPDNRGQYISIKFLNKDSVKEDKLNKRTEAIIKEYMNKHSIHLLAGAKDFDIGVEGVDDIVIEGFDDVKNNW